MRGRSSYARKVSFSPLERSDDWDDFRFVGRNSSYSHVALTSHLIHKFWNFTKCPVSCLKCFNFRGRSSPLLQKDTDPFMQMHVMLSLEAHVSATSRNPNSQLIAMWSIWLWQALYSKHMPSMTKRWKLQRSTNPFSLSIRSLHFWDVPHHGPESCI